MCNAGRTHARSRQTAGARRRSHRWCWTGLTGRGIEGLQVRLGEMLGARKGDVLELSRAQGRSAACIYVKSLQCAGLALVVCVIYANTLHSPFVLDDTYSIQNNVHIRLET